MNALRTEGPSDRGLAGERTSLAWFRLGLTLLGVPSAMLAYYRGSSLLASAAAATAALLGLVILVASLRRPRVPAGSLSRQTIRPPVLRIAGTGAAVLLLALAAAELVLA